MLNRLFITCVGLVFACACMAQEAGDSILRAFDARFHVLDSLIFRADPSAAAGTEVFSSNESVAQRERYNNIIDQRVAAETEEMRSVNGIQLTGQTYYRLDGDLGINDEDAVSRYTGKVQVEARWYFFQSSFYQRRGKTNAIVLKGEIDKTAYKRDHLDDEVYLQKELFRHRSDSILAGALRYRVENLAMLSDANLYLLKNENVSSDELLNILDSRAEAERQLATLSGDYPALPTLASVEAYAVEVDTTQLLTHILDTQIDLYLLQKQMELIDQQRENSTFWTKANVAPFLRLSYYARNYTKDTKNVEAGLSFTVPLNNEAAKHRRTLDTQRRMLEDEQMNVKKEMVDRIRYIDNEIRRLNRASEGEVRRMHELKRYITMRREAYDNRIGQYSRLARLKEYNNYIVCIEKLADFQYRRDCLVADLQRMLVDRSILEFCQERELK